MDTVTEPQPILLTGFSLVTSSSQLALYGSENFALLNTDKF